MELGMAEKELQVTEPSTEPVIVEPSGLIVPARVKVAPGAITEIRAEVTEIVKSPVFVLYVPAISYRP